MVEPLDGSRPPFGKTFLEAFLSVVIDPLHHVAEKTKRKSLALRSLDSEQRIDEMLVRILALVDEKDRISPDEDALHGRLLV
ncbi:hypothetical protein D3C86_1956890 [compost metagenome]